MNKYITTSVERTDNELKIKENEIGSILDFLFKFSINEIETKLNKFCRINFFLNKIKHNLRKKKKKIKLMKTEKGRKKPQNF